MILDERTLSLIVVARAGQSATHVVALLLGDQVLATAVL